MILTRQRPWQSRHPTRRGRHTCRDTAIRLALETHHLALQIYLNPSSAVPSLISSKPPSPTPAVWVSIPRQPSFDVLPPPPQPHRLLPPTPHPMDLPKSRPVPPCPSSSRPSA